MSRRETVIEENKYIFEATSVDVISVIESFKKEFPSKTMIEIEPLLNAILTNNKINAEQQEVLVNSIRENINIYYYMNNDILIKLINHVAGSNMKRKLQKIKKNPIDILDVNEEEYNNLKKEQQQIHLIRFDNTVERYRIFLINVLS